MDKFDYRHRMQVCICNGESDDCTGYISDNGDGCIHYIADDDGACDWYGEAQDGN